MHVCLILELKFSEVLDQCSDLHLKQITGKQCPGLSFDKQLFIYVT